MDDLERTEFVECNLPLFLVIEGERVAEGELEPGLKVPSLELDLTRRREMLSCLETFCLNLDFPTAVPSWSKITGSEFTMGMLSRFPLAAA